jgi:hypothetical protein
MILNVVYVTQLCSGSISDNIGAGSLLAFFPWFLIFGAVLIIIFMYPGLKTVFSNVVGYLVISSQANQILTYLFDNPEINTQLNKLTNENEKNELKKSADLILRICSDKSILVNELNPLNYDKMFDSLRVLFNPEIKDVDENKEKLRKLVLRKEYVGEFCWYLYTGIFLVSVVSYNTTSRGCVKNLTTMQNNYNQYVSESATLQSQNSATTTQLYS